MNEATAIIELELPWSVSAGEDRRFYRHLLIGLLVFIVPASLVPLIPIEDAQRVTVREPPHLARLLIEKIELPVQESIAAVKLPELAAKPEPEPEPALKPKPNPVPDPVAEKIVDAVTPPKPELEVIDVTQQAKAKAMASGLLALRDDLSAMRERVNVDAMHSRPLSRGASSSETASRALIASYASRGTSVASIGTPELGRTAQVLAGRNVTTVIVQPGSDNGVNKIEAESRLSIRSDESIRRVMDRNKGAIYSIYNRALRKNPRLEGLFVFEMMIEPDGAVSALRLISDELTDDVLANKILRRIQMINFGLADAATTTVNYSFDFLPF